MATEWVRRYSHEPKNGVRLELTDMDPGDVAWPLNLSGAWSLSMGFFIYASQK